MSPTYGMLFKGFAAIGAILMVSTYTPHTTAFFDGAPSVGSITATPNPVMINTTVTARATFTDSDANDTHTAVWDWDANNFWCANHPPCSSTTPFTSPGTVNATDKSVDGDATYAAAGLYTLKLDVTDNPSGLTGSGSLKYVAVFDPAAGYVYGSGSVKAPAYSYGTLPASTFTFTQLSAKYVYNSTLNTYSISSPYNVFKFSFSPAKLSFNSTRMDWLVVSGDNVWLKGVGNAVINGVLVQGPTNFLLSAVNSNSTKSPDKVRVKIWKSSGEVIFDNQKDATGDDAHPGDAQAATTGPGTVNISR